LVSKFIGRIFIKTFFQKDYKLSILNKDMMNKKGWIKIFEAVIAILLIASVLLIVVGQRNIQKNEDSLEIYKEEISILREIQLNNSLRADILKSDYLPIGWNDFETNDLDEVKEKISLKIPDYLNCEAMVCEMTDNCILEEDSGKAIYAQSIVISVNIDSHPDFNMSADSRQLKLFCWKV